MLRRSMRIKSNAKINSNNIVTSAENYIDLSYDSETDLSSVNSSYESESSDHSEDTPIPKTRRYDCPQNQSELFIKQKCFCNSCFKILRDKEIDHIIRKADGGGDEIENLQLLCPDCHSIKTKYIDPKIKTGTSTEIIVHTLRNHEKVKRHICGLWIKQLIEFIMAWGYI